MFWQDSYRQTYLLFYLEKLAVSFIRRAEGHFVSTPAVCVQPQSCISKTESLSELTCKSSRVLDTSHLNCAHKARACQTMFLLCLWYIPSTAGLLPGSVSLFDSFIHGWLHKTFLYLNCTSFPVSRGSFLVPICAQNLWRIYATRRTSSLALFFMTFG